MKFQNTLANIAIFSLATGAGSAFAQDICEGYYIQGQTFDSLTLNGQSCFLQQVTIEGDLTVTNAGKFNIQNSNVGGTIRVAASGDVDINDTNPNRLVLIGNEKVDVTLVIADTAIRVIRNGTAFVAGNAAPIINCRGNIRTVGTQNFSSGGNNCETVGLR